MIENGWEEIVARQALLAQWTIDQRKAMGVNTTAPADVLASIRPTLKKVKEDEADNKVNENKQNTKSNQGGNTNTITNTSTNTNTIAITNS